MDSLICSRIFTDADGETTTERLKQNVMCFPTLNKHNHEATIKRIKRPNVNYSLFCGGPPDEPN